MSLEKLKGAVSEDYLNTLLRREDTFVLYENEDEFIQALLLQEKLNDPDNKKIRVSSPVTLAAFAQAYYSMDDMQTIYNTHYRSWRCNANLSLYLEDKKLDLDLNRYIGIIPNEGAISISAEIHTNKCVYITITNGKKESTYTLAEMLMRH